MRACVCVCARARAYALKIISPDKILCFITTFIVVGVGSVWRFPKDAQSRCVEIVTCGHGRRSVSLGVTMAMFPWLCQTTGAVAGVSTVTMT